MTLSLNPWNSQQVTFSHLDTLASVYTEPVVKEMTPEKLKSLLEGRTVELIMPQYMATNDTGSYDVVIEKEISGTPLEQVIQKIDGVLNDGNPIFCRLAFSVYGPIGGTNSFSLIVNSNVKKNFQYEFKCKISMSGLEGIR